MRGLVFVVLRELPLVLDGGIMPRRRGWKYLDSEGCILRGRAACWEWSSRRLQCSIIVILFKWRSIVHRGVEEVLEERVHEGDSESHSEKSGEMDEDEECRA